jgi:hypothetical protein
LKLAPGQPLITLEMLPAVRARKLELAHKTSLFVVVASASATGRPECQAAAFAIFSTVFGVPWQNASHAAKSVFPLGPGLPQARDSNPNPRQGAHSRFVGRDAFHCVPICLQANESGTQWNASLPALPRTRECAHLPAPRQKKLSHLAPVGYERCIISGMCANNKIDKLIRWPYLPRLAGKGRPSAGVRPPGVNDLTRLDPHAWRIN